MSRPMTPSSESSPLSETTYLILLSLVPEPRHGYGIMKAVETLSEGKTRLSTGTLYGALNRLLEDGWIERLENDEPPQTKRLRKAYRLTKLGQRMLESEIARLQRLLALGQLHTGKESF